MRYSGSGSCSGEQEPELGHTRSDGYTRDVVGEAIGLSGSTYQRMKHVVQTANDPDQSDEVREVAALEVEGDDEGVAP